MCVCVCACVCVYYHALLVVHLPSANTAARGDECAAFFRLRSDVLRVAENEIHETLVLTCWDDSHGAWTTWRASDLDLDEEAIKYEGAVQHLFGCR